MDIYGYWKSAVAGKPDNGKKIPTMYRGTEDGVSFDDPQPGLYRTRLSKGGPYVPVKIMLVTPAGDVSHKQADNLTLVGWIDGRRVNAEAIADRWHFLEPVSKADDAHYTEHGRWPGDVAGIGHNAPPEETLPERITRLASEALAWLGRIGTIGTETDASMAANYRDQLNKAKSEADKTREAEIRPHLDAQRDINGRFKPLIEEADNASKTLGRAVAQFLAKVEDEKRRIAEAARRAAEDAARKEQERIAAEAKAKGQPPAPRPVVPVAPVVVEPKRTAVGGQYGKKTTLKTVKNYTVTDYAAALAHVKDHKDVVAAVEKVAKAMARAGASVPGVTITEEAAV